MVKRRWGDGRGGSGCLRGEEMVRLVGFLFVLGGGGWFGWFFLLGGFDVFLGGVIFVLEGVGVGWFEQAFC